MNNFQSTLPVISCIHTGVLFWIVFLYPQGYTTPNLLQLDVAMVLKPGYGIHNTVFSPFI